MYDFILNKEQLKDLKGEKDELVIQIKQQKLQID
jgi:hypothetical protein